MRMGNPDIRDYINNLDQNKDNDGHQVDAQEIQLLHTALANSESDVALVDVLNQKDELKKLTKFVINGIENQKDSISLGYYMHFVQQFQNYMNGLTDKDMGLINELNNAISRQGERINKQQLKKDRNDYIRSDDIRFTTPDIMTEIEVSKFQSNNKEESREKMNLSDEHTKALKYGNTLLEDKEESKKLFDKYLSKDEGEKLEKMLQGNMSQGEGYISSVFKIMFETKSFKNLYGYMFSEANGQDMTDADYEDIKKFFSNPPLDHIVSALENQISTLTDKEIMSFKGVVESLKSGKVSIDQLDPLDKMNEIILTISMLDKKNSEKVIALFDTIVKDRFPNMLNSKEYGELKDILGGLLQRKDILMEFATTVQDDIKGLSYDTLLKNENLYSNDVKKSINTIFHRDEKSFNNLIQDFNDPQKKVQVENIVKQYVKFSAPDIDLNNAHVGMTEISVNGKQKKAFQLLDTSGNAITITKKNEKGENIQVPLTPFFGDSQKGEIISLQDCVSQNQWVKDALQIGPDNMKQLNPKLQKLMKQTIETASGKKVSISEAISGFFNSPLFLEIKQAFLSLLSMLGDDTDKQTKYAIEANFAQAERDISKITETIKDKNGNQISYLKALKSLNLENKDMGENIDNPKERFANAPLENQKKYIEEVIADPNLRYNKDTLDKLGKKVSQSETLTSDNKNKVETTDQKDIPQEFISGGEYKELSLDGTKPVKVEKIDTDTNNSYLRTDGQVIPLINGKGSIFIKGSDGQIIEKIITITQNKDKKEIIAITDGEKLDMGLLETIKKTGNLSVLGNGKLDDNKLKLAKYYMFGKSIDGINNPIDGLLAGINKLGPDQKKISELSLVKFQKEMLVLMSGNISNISEIVNPFTIITKEFQSIKIGNNIQQKERNTIVENRENNYHS